jgi:hypothetical protein
MKTVYVAMEALQAPGGPVEPTLGYSISSYAKPFMHWCASNARTVLLTDDPLPHALLLLRHLGVEGAVPVRAFESSKAEIFNPHEDFYLVDDALIPSEVSWFAEHGLGDRVISVNPATGVAPQTKQRLEARLHERRRG